MSSRISALLGCTMTAIATAMSASALAQDSQSDSVVEAAKAAAAAEGGNDGLIQVIGEPVYVSPMVTAVFADGKRQIEDGMGVSLAVGRRITNRLTLEVSSYLTRNKASQTSNLDYNPGDQHTTGYGLSALVWPFSGKAGNIYGLLGANYVDGSDAPISRRVGPVNNRRTEGSSTNYNGWSVDAGAGLMTGIAIFGKPAALRLEARYRFEKSDETLGDLDEGKDKFGDIVVALGVTVPLFWKEPAPPAAAEQPVEVTAPVDSSSQQTDSDNDGIIDSMDKCPDTPADSQVDMDGCPQAAPQG